MHPALVEQAQERLAERDEAELVQDLDEVAGVEQVHDGVIDAADALVDGEPVVDERTIEGRLVVARIAVTQEVPGRVDERVHRVGFAPSFAAAARTGNADPVLRRFERRLASRRVVVDLG